MDTPKSTPQIPTSVYKYYDAQGVLIYVGITKQRTGRNRQHNADKEWWPFVASQKVEHLPSRLCALNRERDLILLNCPPFNKAHNKDHAALKAAYLGLTDAAAQGEQDPKKLLLIRRNRLRLQVIKGELYSCPEDAPLARVLVEPPSSDLRNQPVLYNGKQIGIVAHVQRGGHLVKIHASFANGGSTYSQSDFRSGFAKLVHNYFKKHTYELFVKSVHLEDEVPRVVAPRPRETESTTPGTP